MTGDFLEKKITLIDIMNISVLHILTGMSF